jgi:thiosulfate/3-mercaptopyruvate sulfurtransferase
LGAVDGEEDNTHKFKPYSEVKAELEAAGITPDKEVLAYCGDFA